MTKAFDSIKKGMTEAVAHAKSKGVKPAGVKLYQPHAVDVSSLRALELDARAIRRPLRIFGRHTAPPGARRPCARRCRAGFLNVVVRNPGAVLGELS